MNYKEKLDTLLRENNYFSLATVDADGNPWISPLTYVYGKSNMLYFVSNQNALHTKNLAHNSRVAVSIFASNQSSGNAFGAQGIGTVKKIELPDVPSVIRGDLLAKVSMIILNRPYDFFCVHLEEMYLPNMERWKDETPLRVLVFKNPPKNNEK